VHLHQVRRLTMIDVLIGSSLMLAGCGRTADDARGAVAAPLIEWSSSAGDAGSQRYSPAADITKDNVVHLAAAWTWRTGETAGIDPATGEHLAPGKFEATPVMLRDTLYLSTPFSRAVALDARTGHQFWSFDPDVTRWGWIANDHSSFVHRGVAVWTPQGPHGVRRVFLTARWQLYALDAATGRKIDSFGDNGSIDLTAHLRWPTSRTELTSTSPPAIWRNVVIVGSSISDRVIYPRDPPGDVQAFDAVTGRSIWRWDPVPPPGSADRRTWAGNSADITGHMNVWAPISIDSARGYVYLPVSTPSNDWYGGNRLGDDLYAESIVCLEAATGRTVWSRQLVHHGLWDYDLDSAPILAQIRSGRDTSDVVIVTTKHGFTFVFDRVTGHPRWPIEERPVPTSTVPGEQAAPTQPVPTWPAPFAKQGFTDTDIVDFSPAIHAAARELLRGKRLGPLFTPPSLEGTVVMPGWNGGGGWGAGAVDPGRQLLVVKATNQPVLAQLIPSDSATRFRIDTAPESPLEPLLLHLGGHTWYGGFRKEADVPVNKPPYGTLTAIDLATGNRKWQVILGDTPELRNHPALRRLKLPQLGVFGAPGGVVTATGLIFITGGGTTLYAIDVESGATLWSAPLGQIGYSNPMTYRASDGRQYVVVATGKGMGANVQAFALPHR
jgi:quinoprotein glucose dehydrogenase